MIILLNGHIVKLPDNHWFIFIDLDCFQPWSKTIVLQWAARMKEMLSRPHPFLRSCGQLNAAWGRKNHLKVFLLVSFSCSTDGPTPMNIRSVLTGLGVLSEKGEEKEEEEET